MDKTRTEQILENSIFYLMRIRVGLTRDKDFEEWKSANDAIIIIEHALKEVKNE